MRTEHMTEHEQHAAPDAEAPSPEMRRRAQLFWAQSGDDLKAAKRYLRRRDFVHSGFHSFQCAVNALSCVCYLHGYFQLPANSPLRLLVMAAGVTFVTFIGTRLLDRPARPVVLRVLPGSVTNRGDGPRGNVFR